MHEIEQVKSKGKMKQIREGEESCSVFISYSHDSIDHSEKVLNLSDSLMKDGIYCILDQYETAPKEGWVKWMTRHTEESDFNTASLRDDYY